MVLEKGILMMIVRYVLSQIQVRRTAVSQALQKSFHILGWLSGFQLCVSLLWHALKLRKMMIHQSPEAPEGKERYIMLMTKSSLLKML